MNQTTQWHRFPFVRIFLITILGIWCQEVCDVNATVFSLFLVGLALFHLVKRWIITRTSVRWIFSRVLGVGLTLVIFTAANTFCNQEHGRSRGNHFSNHWNKDSKGVILIKELQRSSNKWLFFEAEAKRVVKDQQSRAVHGKLQLALRRSEHSPGEGDLVMLNQIPQTIQPPENPGMFDYSSYMKSMGITHVIWSDKSDLVVMGSVAEGYVSRLKNYFSLQVEDVFGDNIRSEVNRGLLKALVTGDKSGISGEVKSTFSETGTIHVLAISGLHVGIIYLLVSALLKRLFFARRLRVFRSVLVVAVLMIYALITGLQPSVFRASLMFGLFEFSKIVGRKGEPLNILTAVGFLILIVDPGYLDRVGFQFSFLAVAAILLWHKKLSSKLRTKSSLANKLIDLLLLSFLAQMALMPLSIYYFHQFPMYFLVANLVVVPCISVVMVLAVALLITGGIPILPEIISFVLESYLWFVRWFISRIHEIPGNLRSEIWWDEKYTLLVAIIVVMAIGMLSSSYRKMRMYFIWLLVVQCIWFGADSIRTESQHKVMNFKNQESEATVIIHGRRATVITFDTISEMDFERNILPGLRMNGANEIKVVTPADSAVSDSFLRVEHRTLTPANDGINRQELLHITDGLNHHVLPLQRRMWP